MYAVKYEMMFMPVCHFCNTREEAEKMAEKVRKQFPNVTVTIEGE